jgi:hypothetical protein
MVSINKILFCFLIISVTILACSTSEQTTDNSEYDQQESIDNSDNLPEGDESQLLISSLSDTYSSNSNSIPQEFVSIKKKVEEEVDLTKGFRIQVYSGKDIYEADSLASKFRAWSDTTIVGYQAETYTFFKTPYYRVHVGDFHNRDKAFLFSKMVKRLFKDAWVVYDTVDPFSVPSDTTQIKFQEL